MSINMTKKFVFVSDELASVRKVLMAILPVLFEDDKPNPVYTKWYASSSGAYMFMDGRYDNDERIPTKFWVATLADYKPNFDPKVDVPFDSYEQMADHVIELLQDTKRHALARETLGDGYDECFMRSDGTIKLGYRIEHAPNGGWNLLQASLTHVHYGK